MRARPRWAVAENGRATAAVGMAGRQFRQLQCTKVTRASGTSQMPVGLTFLHQAANIALDSHGHTLLSLPAVFPGRDARRAGAPLCTAGSAATYQEAASSFAGKSHHDHCHWRRLREAG